MSDETRIKSCEEICRNRFISSFEKLFKLIQNLFGSEYIHHNKDLTPYITCPYCGEKIFSQNIEQDLNFVYIRVNEFNQVWYQIIMPCCQKEVFSTQYWTTDCNNERELLSDARMRYYKLKTNAKNQYDVIKAKYNTICDIMYNKYILNGDD